MRLTLEPLDPTRDLALLHAWVTHPRSVFWGMQDATPEHVHEEYARIADDPHHDALLGRADGDPAFLMERYDPAHSPLAGLPYRVRKSRNGALNASEPTKRFPSMCASSAPRIVRSNRRSRTVIFARTCFIVCA